MFMCEVFHIETLRLLTHIIYMCVVRVCVFMCAGMWVCIYMCSISYRNPIAITLGLYMCI